MTTEEAILIERQRCADICRRRVELWRNTELARSGIPSAEQEARARANEAAYLADWIESGSDLAEMDSPVH
jgi:hypothetical protein